MKERVKEHHEEPQAHKELRAAGTTNGSANGAVDGVRSLYSQTTSLEKSSQARGLSQTMRDPARRKRNASPKKGRANGRGGASSSLTESPNETKTNGKLDGSGLPALPAGAPERRGSGFVLINPELEGVAASDDATGTTFAGDAAPTSAAACTGRDACAEVAAPRSLSSAVRGEKSGTADDRRPRACDDLDSAEMKKSKKTSGKTRSCGMEKTEPKEYPPGTGEPLALDAPGFVEQMHERVNLYEVYKTLLTTGDLKVQQRAAEFLMEMKYGKGAAGGSDEVTHVDVEFPKPQ